MRERKLGFWSDIISAITLDKYQEFASEKFTKAIKFIAKLMLIFAAIVSIGVTFKFINMVNTGTLIEHLNEMNNFGIQSNISEEMINEIKNLDGGFLYLVFYVVTFIYTYLTYFILVIMDILLLSILGYFVSRIFKIRLRYEAIYNISTYSLVLSIILNMIYIMANLFLGYTIEYFNIVYNIISYIYLTAAILIIRSDIIKTNIELIAIEQEQKRIKQEMEEQQDEEKQNNKEEKDKKEEKKEDDSDSNEIPTPEGEQ